MLIFLFINTHTNQYLADFGLCFKAVKYSFGKELVFLFFNLIIAKNNATESRKREIIIIGIK
jgi:hypothetical protein